VIKEQVKPKDIDISKGLTGALQKSEKETVARNIILIARKVNDWKNFTFSEYQELCSHRVTGRERGVLNELVSDGLLDCNKGVYSVKDAFIAKLWKFVKTAD